MMQPQPLHVGDRVRSTALWERLADLVARHDYPAPLYHRLCLHVWAWCLRHSIHKHDIRRVMPMNVNDFKVGNRVAVAYAMEPHYREGEQGTVIRTLGKYIQVALDEPRYTMVKEQKLKTGSVSFLPDDLVKVGAPSA
jgi:hypothetical protein